LLVKDEEREWYIKVVEGYKDIENNFNSNDFPNNDLESKF
jgi:hypothetical protein